MNRLTILLVLISISNIFAQTNFTIKGTVTDNTGQGLEDVIIKIDPSNTNLFSDKNGYYEQTLPKGKYTIIFTWLAAKPITKTIVLDKNTQLNIALTKEDIELGEVVVVSKSLIDINSTELGTNIVEIESLKKLPQFMGELDIVKTISSLPGVISGGEGSSGFYVRGGGADQNLVLFDDAPVFNTSHLFGFFSIFNPDIIKNYTFNRSGISAKYGGRISSILDVNTIDKKPKKTSGTIGVSPITTKGSIVGNLGNKTSYFIAGRLAYPNYILKQFKNENVKNSKAGYYDANLKINHDLTKKDLLSLSTYYSSDNFKFPYDTTYKYTNALGTLKWRHLFSEKFSASLALVYSTFNSNVFGLAPEEQFKLSSSINNKQIKLDFIKHGKLNNIDEFGLQYNNYSINPGNLEILSEQSAYNPIKLQEDLGNELAAYYTKDIKFSEKLSSSLGLRYSYFNKLGPSTVFTENEVINISKNEVEVNYGGLEPRAAIKYSLSKESSIKFGYNRGRQNLHLISNSNAITPADVWRLSSRTIKPQISDQFSVGYFKVPESQNYELSLELYYKTLQNQIDYKNGSEILLNPNLPAELLIGIGKAYGIEGFFKKNKGDFTGWLSLSVSKSLRQIQGETIYDSINDGEWYPSNFDKPVNLNIFANYQWPLSNWSISSNFNYNSGRPIAAADSWFSFYPDQNFANYKGRNRNRMQDNFRLDVSLLRSSIKKEGFRAEWGISIYNLLYRQNPFSTYFTHYYGSRPQAYKLSIIGVAVPSVNINFKF